MGEGTAITQTKREEPSSKVTAWCRKEKVRKAAKRGTTRLIDGRTKDELETERRQHMADGRMMEGTKRQAVRRTQEETEKSCTMHKWCMSTGFLARSPKW